MALPQDGAKETSAEQAGYTVPLSLAQAVKEWANIHDDAFSMIVHSIVRIRGGVDWVLNNERCMVFFLRPLQRLFDNPTTALEVSSLMLLSKYADTGDDNEPFRDLWEEPLRAKHALDTAQITADDPNPRFTGLLSATFMVIDTEVILHSYYRMYCPRVGRLNAQCGHELQGTKRCVAHRQVAEGVTANGDEGPLRAKPVSSTKEQTESRPTKSGWR
ncbi:hypothetical protein V8D89_003675 [Ganoderma adspersum]